MENEDKKKREAPPEELIKILTKMIEEKPDYEDLYLCRGNLYLELNDIDNALADYTKIMELLS